MKTGQILESRIPERTRAIVFHVYEFDKYMIVTDYGNISFLTEAETLSIYKITNEWSSPDVWLQGKVNLIKELVRRFPELKELVDFNGIQ